jgi:hypothetical protein
MNHLLKSTILVSIFLFAASLKSGQQTESPRFKHVGSFTASIDGRPFDTHHYEKYTAEISSQPGISKAGQSADLTFYGGTHYDRSGNVFEETLQFKYQVDASGAGTISAQKIVFDFDNQKFMSIPGQTKFTITKAEYSSDRTSMIVSAVFEAKMTPWVAPGQAAPIIKVKGKMEGISVSVPASKPVADL